MVPSDLVILTSMAWIVGIVALVTAYALLRRNPAGDDVRPARPPAFLTNLRSTDAEVRERAQEDLEESWGSGALPRKYLQFVYEELRQSYPDDGNEWCVRNSLLKALQSQRSSEKSEKTIVIIQEIFPTLPDESREPALEVLGQFGIYEAIEVMLNLLETHRPDLGRFPSWKIWGPHHSQPLPRRLMNMYFPRVLGLLDDASPESLRRSVYALIESQVGNDCTIELTTAAKDQLAQDIEHNTRILEEPPSDEKAFDARQTLRDLIIIGKSLTTDDARVVDAIKAVTTLPAEHAWMYIEREDVRASATLALLEMGMEPPPEQLAIYFNDTRLRYYLMTSLIELKRTDLIPGELRSQRAMAEADLVYWLCSPSEMCGPPESIELIQESRITVDGDSARIFIFAVLYPENPDNSYMPSGWMIGFSGPCALHDELEPLHERFGSMTGSEFALVSEGSVDDLLDEWLESSGNAYSPKRIQWGK